MLLVLCLCRKLVYNYFVERMTMALPASPVASAGRNFNVAPPVSQLPSSNAMNARVI